MKKTIQIAILAFLFIGATNAALAQETVNSDADSSLKDGLYKKYKKEAQTYDKKEFDTLFLEFFQKQKDKKITLSKEAFYTYTIKIAAYSERLGLLYKDQKQDAERTKKEWFARSYSDYINSKK